MLNTDGQHPTTAKIVMHFFTVLSDPFFINEIITGL